MDDLITNNFGRRIIQYKIPALNRLINIEQPTGKRKLQLRELQKELSSLANEDERINGISKIILEFTDFTSIEEVDNTLTDVEIFEIFLSIQGDFESTKKVFSLSKI